MNFIRAFFNAKFRAINALLDVAKDAWDQRLWLAVVLVILWATVCTIGGILFFPIDFIRSAIGWHKNADVRNAIEHFADGSVYDISQ